MRPEEIAAAHDRQVAGLKAAAPLASAELEKAAVDVARMVKAEAARRGHSVGIRIVRKSTGVRVTVTGPHASQYRTAVEKALAARVPQAATEVRAQITRRAK